MSDIPEKLKIKIGLHGSGSPYPCNFLLKVNDIVYVEAESKNETTYYTFQTNELKAHNILSIELLDKNNNKHVTKDSNGNIIEDFLLNIESIEIDDIDLGNLLWTASKYYPVYPDNYINFEQKNQEFLTKCVSMGWNGNWTLEFSSPFYIWLLENI